MFASSWNSKHFFDISFVFTTDEHVASGFLMCVPLSYKGMLSAVGNVFWLGWYIHLHDCDFCSNSCVHAHSWTCLCKWACPVSGRWIRHPKVALDSVPFLSTALSRFCCEGVLYSLSSKPPQKWWVNFRRILQVQRAFVGCFGTAVLLVLLK